MLNSQTTESNANPTVPKAYINYLFFDEQFKCVGTGFSKVGTNSVVKDHYSQLQNLTVPKNGFVYIYCSNESPVDVFFDNLQVVHTRGQVLEETHYYPFGGRLAGICSQSAGKLSNKFLYNGKELQSKEFSDGSGLELLDFGARMYDPQIGRWGTIDSMADSRHEGLSPYAYVYNNPVLYSDHEGKFGFAGALIGGLIGAAASLTKSVIQNGFESLGDSKTWAKAGVNAAAGAIVGATGGIALLSTAGATAAGIAATAVTSFGTSIAEDKIDGNQVDYGKAAFSSFVATATFGFGKYGADKLTRSVRTNWWNRTNTNAFVRYLGRSPTTNVGQVVDRVVDVAGFGSSFSADYFFLSPLITSSATNNSDKPKSTVVVEPVQIIPPFDPNEKK